MIRSSDDFNGKFPAGLRFLAVAAFCSKVCCGKEFDLTQDCPVYQCGPRSIAVEYHLMVNAMKAIKWAIGFGTVALCVLLIVPQIAAANMDGVMMSDGKVVMMHAGKPAGPMEHQMIMSNGATVFPDGTVQLKDGTRFQMKNGQMIMMDGHLMEGGKAMAMHQ
jgi:hypothetical protein